MRNKKLAKIPKIFGNSPNKIAKGYLSNEFDQLKNAQIQ